MRMCPPAPGHMLSVSSWDSGRYAGASPGAARGKAGAHVAQRGEAVAQHQLGEPHISQLCCVVARQEHVGRLHTSHGQSW